ncbi:MAG: SDR family NAD(P)-dependent oxidoreductase, partial [Proteobacteria bacterium]|nr:SDR family NAD(P)-dependent oxidoreductase [Pseudomonadota bacterium]
MVRTNQNFGLNGKVAIVTGASSGIGAAIASALALAGASVVAVGRDTARLDAIQRKIEALGNEAAIVNADLTSEEGINGVVESALNRFGQLDILVNSAGIFAPASFLDTSSVDLDKHWAVNVRAPFLLTQRALPHLRPGSSIIFITSTVARVGFANTAAYSASKAALDGMMRVMAIELAPRGIAVNGVAPGWTATPMNEAIREDADVVAAAVSATPCGRLAVPDDIAPSVVFLASEASRFIQGVVLDVGGGYPSLPNVIRRTEPGKPGWG